MRKLGDTITHSDIHLDVETLREAIEEECGELSGALLRIRWIWRCKNTDHSYPDTFQYPPPT